MQLTWGHTYAHCADVTFYPMSLKKPHEKRLQANYGSEKKWSRVALHGGYSSKGSSNTRLNALLLVKSTEHRLLTSQSACACFCLEVEK